MTSLPAKKASRSAIPGSKCFVTPFISIASVYTIPSNPNSLRNTSTIVGPDNVVGLFSRASRAGTFRCATITEVAPCVTNCLNGYNSMLSRRALVWGIMGKSLCESTSVSPWPGKCFRQDMTSTSCMPLI